jgi:hypothetical protein
VLLAPEEPHQGAPPPPVPNLAGRLHLTELGVTEDLVIEMDE